MADIYLGDCREVRSVLADNMIDTIITDPPYGLEFMGKGWDKGVPGVEFWKEFLAVTKPGGMLLAFGGTRTFHRMTVAIEDAGWQIRDCMMWLYGSGFPKSLDISKAIDKAKGAERREGGRRWSGGQRSGGIIQDSATEVTTTRIIYDTPATDLSREWSGWGTALKPAWEPIIVAMKPIDGTFAQNAQKWGVAGLNVDGGRIEISDELPTHRTHTQASSNVNLGGGCANGDMPNSVRHNSKGRWPANLLLDEDAAAMLDEQSGVLKSGAVKATHRRHTATGNGNTHGEMKGVLGPLCEANSGGASRFFYCAKASKSERGDSTHPTMKPLKLMEYLCTLTKTPTGGIVLDPFAGSGTTLLAAKNTGREYVGIEQNAEYFEIIKARLGVK